MTRKEKIASERRRQKELERVEAYNQNRLKDGEATTVRGKNEKVKYGERNVGAFDSLKKQNTEEGDLKFVDYGSGPSDKVVSKRSKRIEEGNLAKEYRKNTRAEKLGEKRGLSDQQSKDFMQNRRDRFKQRTGEYLRGLGLSTNIIGEGNGVDERMYRKDGSGTLQNMKRADGSTYDATKGFGKGKGGTRDEADKYFDIIQPKREKDITPKGSGEIGYEAKGRNGYFGDPNPTPEEAIEKNNRKKTTEILTPPKEGTELGDKTNDTIPEALADQPKLNSSNTYSGAAGVYPGENRYISDEMRNTLSNFKDKMFKGGINWTGEDDDRKTTQGNLSALDTSPKALGFGQKGKEQSDIIDVFAGRRK